MAYDSATVLAPEVPVPTAKLNVVPPLATYNQSSADRMTASTIHNAVLELDRPSESIRLSLASILSITIAGLVITVALVMTLSRLLN